MLTTVILEGAMGKAFGRTWELSVRSAADALRLIDANKPGLFAWVRGNLQKYSRYKVLCEFADGRKEFMDKDTLFMRRNPVKIRFVPLIEGAGSGGRFILGAIIFGVSAYYGFQPGMAMGASMMIGAVIEMLSPKPTAKDKEERTDRTSHYFDGPVNTTMQGVPVQLIYGTDVLVGSHPISADMTIDQLYPGSVDAPPAPPILAPEPQQPIYDPVLENGWF